MSYFRPRSSSSSSAISSTSSSPSFSGEGWVPQRAALSPACTTTNMDYFTSSSRRGSTSSTTSTVSSSSSSPCTPSIAYPSWPVGNSLTDATTKTHKDASELYYMTNSYISDDDLEALDFSSQKSTPEPEVAGGEGISWSETKQPCAPRAEERRRRLPPPPPGMVTTTGGTRRKVSKERRRKALSIIKE